MTNNEASGMLFIQTLLGIEFDLDITWLLTLRTYSHFGMNMKKMFVKNENHMIPTGPLRMHL